MSMLLHVLPHRRRSRRRTRYLRTRVLVVAAILLLCAYSVWQPGMTVPDSIPPTGSALPDAALSGAEPEESVDTEGALADRYVADR